MEKSSNKSSWLRNFLFSSLQNAKESEPQYILLGIIGFIGFGLYYFIWHNVEITQYENMTLRIVAMTLCLGLILKNYWPKEIQAFLPIYWHLTLLYIMPFFFSFMLFKNNFSEVWVINSMTQLFYLILLTDWSITLLLFTLGTCLAWLTYTLTSTNIYLPLNLNGLIFAYLAVLGVGALINYNRQRIQNEKIQNLHALGASIAHELRTPLASLNVATDTLNTVLPHLFDAYLQAKKVELPIHPIKIDHFELLQQKLDNMKKEIRGSLTFIDMLLLNLNPKNDKSKAKLISAIQCIDESLLRYPFVGNENNLVKWKADIKEDFLIQADPTLITHVFFNLLKNAIYYVQKAGKGNIEISIKKEKPYNLIYFKDTGAGIPRAALPHIFERFFSKTYHGAGVGLTFCRWVMNDLGGEITCESIEGDYTLFILRFPDKEHQHEQH